MFADLGHFSQLSIKVRYVMVPYQLAISVIEISFFHDTNLSSMIICHFALVIGKGKRNLLA